MQLEQVNGVKVCLVIPNAFKICTCCIIYVLFMGYGILHA